MDVEAPDRAIAAGTVLNEELNVALGLDLGCNEAREGVDASTRRHGNDDADWAIGENRLRAHDTWREHDARGRQERRNCVTTIRRNGPYWMPFSLILSRAASIQRLWSSAVAKHTVEGCTMAAKNAIPTIDLSPLRGGSGTEKREVARQIDAACTEIGFFQSGHQPRSSDNCDFMSTRPAG
ncbi:MAG: 2-oxoglutarate and iron-dependent oxygenase domain-containing protein [Hyphomicrobiales bacterium]|nr:2-oxoglutarate and iron-dependent oxygenase domain-containing protein [Hyphomicrobiales bacterium]